VVDGGDSGGEGTDDDDDDDDDVDDGGYGIYDTSSKLGFDSFGGGQRSRLLRCLQSSRTFHDTLMGWRLYITSREQSHMRMFSLYIYGSKKQDGVTHEAS
jgi:hypothetical protein